MGKTLKQAPVPESDDWKGKKNQRQWVRRQRRKSAALRKRRKQQE